VEIQGKLRRVIEVWRQRNVFEGPILDAVEARVNGTLFLLFKPTCDNLLTQIPRSRD